MRNRKSRAPTNTTVPLIIRVQHHPRGSWEVIPPGRRGRIRCETLEDARRIAYLSVAHKRPCELIVRDAYHRVVERELIDALPARSIPPEPGTRARAR